MALAPLALWRPGRGGSLLVAAGCGALFARDAQMTLTGAPARLGPLPRLLRRLDGPLGPLSVLAGFLYDEIAESWSLATRREVAALTASKL